MALGMNLASKFASRVDERFTKGSQAALALNNDYSFRGVKTVNVYSIPSVPMTNYTRSGSSRYGTPADLQNNVQELTMSRDRSFTFVIDRGDKIQSQMVIDAGKALARQVREVTIPEYDTYVFFKLGAAAVAASQSDTTTATKNNAYQLFLAAQEALGNACVPDGGRVCFCSYGYANLLKQDPAFMVQSEKSKEAVNRGIIGEVDGVRIVKVPSSRLPSGTSFLLAHPSAACGPKQLQDFKVHDNPPGISGWLVEGRIIYDCFVLNNKRKALYWQGTSAGATALAGSYADPDTSLYGRGGAFAVFTVPSGGNPKTLGLYEFNSSTGKYVATTDTSVTSGKNYYKIID